MFYITFIISAILYSLITAIFSFKLNSGDKVFWVAYFLNIIPVWTLLSKYSQNILFDAMIYDLILFLGYSGTLIYLTNHKMTINSYAGLILIIAGMFLFKRG